MKCPNCGSELEPGAKFCGNCGFRLETPADAAPAAAPAEEMPVQPEPAYREPVYQEPEYREPVYEQPDYQQQNYSYTPNQVYYGGNSTVDNEAEQRSQKSCLVIGILSVAFAFSTILSIVGFILGIVGLNKAKNHLAAFGTYPGKVRAGKYLSLGGLISGIVIAIIVFIYIVLAIFMVSRYGSFNFNSYLY